jgi:hypothetical protein
MIEATVGLEFPPEILNTILQTCKQHRQESTISSREHRSGSIPVQTYLTRIERATERVLIKLGAVCILIDASTDCFQNTKASTTNPKLEHHMSIDNDGKKKFKHEQRREIKAQCTKLLLVYAKSQLVQNCCLYKIATCAKRIFRWLEDGVRKEANI